MNKRVRLRVPKGFLYFMEMAPLSFHKKTDIIRDKLRVAKAKQHE